MRKIYETPAADVVKFPLDSFLRTSPNVEDPAECDLDWGDNA